MKYCPNCGSSVEGKKFCANCGSKVGETTKDKAKTETKKVTKKKATKEKKSFGFFNYIGLIGFLLFAILPFIAAYQDGKF